MQITKQMKRDGKVVATVKSVTPKGINYAVTFDTGYRIIVPVGCLSDEVLAMR